MIRRPPRSTLFPTRRSSDLWTIISPWCVAGDVSNWRTITNNVIVGVIGLVVALAAATTRPGSARTAGHRSEEHTSELQSQFHLVCRLLLAKKKPSFVRRILY